MLRRRRRGVFPCLPSRWRPGEGSSERLCRDGARRRRTRTKRPSPNLNRPRRRFESPRRFPRTRARRRRRGGRWTRARAPATRREHRRRRRGGNAAQDVSHARPRRARRGRRERRLGVRHHSAIFQGERRADHGAGDASRGTKFSSRDPSRNPSGSRDAVDRSARRVPGVDGVRADGGCVRVRRVDRRARGVARAFAAPTASCFAGVGGRGETRRRDGGSSNANAIPPPPRVLVTVETYAPPAVAVAALRRAIERVNAETEANEATNAGRRRWRTPPSRRRRFDFTRGNHRVSHLRGVLRRRGTPPEPRVPAHAASSDVDAIVLLQSWRSGTASRRGRRRRRRPSRSPRSTVDTPSVDSSSVADRERFADASAWIRAAARGDVEHIFGAERLGRDRPPPRRRWPSPSPAVVRTSPAQSWESTLVACTRTRRFARASPLVASSPSVDSTSARSSRPFDARSAPVASRRHSDRTRILRASGFGIRAFSRARPERRDAPRR